MKWDGHTHTHYCRHGSGERTELFVQRAIEMGFSTYTVSEHPPLPHDFLARCPYPQAFLRSIPMQDGQLDGYFRDMEVLKRKYSGRIRVLVGLEVDYLPGHEAWTRNLLREYGPHLDDALLSIHYLEGVGGWRCVDASAEDLDAGLVRFYGGYEQFQTAYYRVVRQALLSDLGPHKPKRLGHLTVCNKFQHRFDRPTEPSEDLKAEIEETLELVGDGDFSLDANMAGLFKEHCREPYPPAWVVALARDRGIPLVYGSDAHSAADVGRGYDVYRQLAR